MTQSAIYLCVPSVPAPRVGQEPEISSAFPPPPGVLQAAWPSPTWGASAARFLGVSSQLGDGTSGKVPGLVIPASVGTSRECRPWAPSLRAVGRAGAGATV